MNGESLNIVNERIARLQVEFPEIFSEGKIDLEKFKATFSDSINIQNERYMLNWAGKSDAFKVLQVPTTATLKPQPEESVNFENTDNVFIEGENLEVLKVLQKSYYGKIKCIIIDPPYNTGNDSFIYPDSFKENKEDYQKRIGEKDEEGYLLKEGFFRKNGKDSGHYHSNWLSMMYPRLFLAKNLLRDDGVIFVHIDDNEVHNLRMIMNEIFGEENFVAQLVWKSRQNKDNRNITGASIDHEYILCFGRRIKGSERKTEQYQNPDNDPRGPWVSGNMVGLLPQELRPNCHYDLINPFTGVNYGKPKLGWRYDKNSMSSLITENRIIWPNSQEGRPRRKVFLHELNQTVTGFSSIIAKNIFTRNGSAEIEKLMDFRAFDFPKPVELISEIIIQGSEENDIILDFFAGSGTTAQAVLELNKEDGGNRKFLLVQLPEKCDENSEAYKAGFKTIADISKERIRRVIRKIEEEKRGKEEKEKGGQGELPLTIDHRPSTIDNRQSIDLGFKSFKLSSSNFKIWRGSEITEENLVQQLDAFTNPVREGCEKENMLYELILKSGYLLTERLELIDGFYSINSGELVIALEKMDQQIIEKIIAIKPKKVITLDNLFNGNDQLKTNAVLQMRDAGVEFKTI